MQTEESRPETVIAPANAIDIIWKVGLTAGVVFLCIKITNQTERCITLIRETNDFQDAFNNFMDDNFGFQQDDVNDLNNVHLHLPD
ncbi:MAG: hypothetical protein LBV62_00125 [Rickettsiales bacterium]|jgi:hypothetical protein|nr:hypothetical protein [Rickettsiales bacterium]